MNKTTLHEIKFAIDSDILKTLRIITFAIVAGASAFFFVILFLFHLADKQVLPEVQDLEMAQLISGINLAIFIVGLALLAIIKKRFYSVKNVESNIATATKNNPEVSIPDIVLGVLRTGIIIEIAVLEGIAFISLVFCMHIITNNVMTHHPVYWLNILPYAYFLYFTIKGIPTKDKIVERVKKDLKFLIAY